MYLSVHSIQLNGVRAHSRVVHRLDDGDVTSSGRQGDCSLNEGNVAKIEYSLDAELVPGDGVLVLVQQTQVVVGDVERAWEELSVGPYFTPELTIQLLVEREVEVSSETLICGLVPCYSNC